MPLRFSRTARGHARVPRPTHSVTASEENCTGIKEPGHGRTTIPHLLTDGTGGSEAGDNETDRKKQLNGCGMWPQHREILSSPSESFCNGYRGPRTAPAAGNLLVWFLNLKCQTVTTAIRSRTVRERAQMLWCSKHGENPAGGARAHSLRGGGGGRAFFQLRDSASPQ